VPQDSQEPSTCVIGAGACGIAVVKALSDQRIAFDCFEKSGGIGGLWGEYETSAAYRSLRINSSRDRTSYRDYPMPEHYPDFPDHTQMARYLNGYVDHFGLRHRITFDTEVTSAEPGGHGSWKITLGTGVTRQYHTLIVANGHHWDPRWPEPSYPGRFDGDVIHSHSYRSPSEPIDLCGRRVLVVGLGNSAVDIACELGQCERAATVYLSARRGAWVLPKRLFGRPIDRLPGTHPLTPWWIQSLILNLLVRTIGGVPWRFGLPKPDHPVLAAHPTISQDLAARIRGGYVRPKPGITVLRGREVEFADGSVEAVDAIIYCTGYNVAFPFFRSAVLAAPGNDLPLWLRLARPGDTNLFFVGLLQPLGAVMPIAEAQAKLIADCIAGRYILPSREEMSAHMNRERRRMFRRYVKSERHTMQVDFDRYLRELSIEHRRGKHRARASERAGD
jgi:hypothetical protein